MSANAEISPDGRAVTVRVPLTLRRRGGRKLVIAPDGAAWMPLRPRVDNSIVKALARAHRWKRLLDSGAYASVTELAETEKIAQSYMCRVLRLTLLAPEIVETILDGRQPASLQLDRLLSPFPVEWEAQWRVLSCRRGA